MSFWGLDSGQWESDTVRVGYPAPANTSFLLVAYVDDPPEGVLYENTSQNESAHVDGVEIGLNSKFSGTHTAQVVMAKDENRNGQFDRETDSPYLKDGEVIRAGPERVGF